MKLLVFFTVGLLAGLASTAPTSNDATSNDDDIVTVNAEFFPDELAIYTAEHDIVNIVVPLNALNFEDDDSDDDDSDDGDATIFFVLADTVDGKRVDQGLYVRKKGQVTKLLDNGRDAAAANDDTKTVYFGAKDGLYIYNHEKTAAEKYGPITDGIISIAKVNGSDALYILTEDHLIYKVTDDGTKKEQVKGAANAQKIVLDYENNLYYYTSDKDIYVVNDDGVKKIEGLPEKATKVDIVKPPFIFDNAIPVMMDSKTYLVYSNGTVENGEFVLEVWPTATAMEATLVQYYGYNKKIYEYNVLALLLGELLDQLKSYLNDKTDTISEIATRSRGDLRP